MAAGSNRIVKIEPPINRVAEYFSQTEIDQTRGQSDVVRQDAITATGVSRKNDQIGLPYRFSSDRKRRKTESVTIRSAVAALVSGVVAALLARWILHAPWLAMKSMFIATTCATLVLAGTTEHKLFCWMWFATIPGVVFFSFLGWYYLPAITITHWTQYLYVPLRMFSVWGISAVVIPSLANRLIDVRPNSYIARPLFWAMALPVLAALVVTGVSALTTTLFAWLGLTYFIMTMVLIAGFLVLYVTLGKVKEEPVTIIITRTLYLFERIVIQRV